MMKFIILTVLIQLPNLLFAQDSNSAPKIKASGGSNCFQSLDAKDMENLGNILYLREQTKSKNTSHSENEVYEDQINNINKNFSGEKKQAAMAVLSMAIASRNEARLKQVMNQALSRGDISLNKSERAQISDLIKDARVNGIDLELLLNLKTASVSQSAKVLKSKGAKILPNGEWKFGKDFDFKAAKKDPQVKEALSDFFPNEVKYLSEKARGYVVIGDRVVMNEFDPHKKRINGQEAEWYWRSDDIEEHTKKTVEIIDRFTKKSEEFAKISKENTHWVKITDAALSADIVCDKSMKDILLAPAFGGIDNVVNFFTGKDDDGMKRWERGLDRQLKIKDELYQITTEMTYHGASEETKAAMRQAISKLQNKSDEDLEKGLAGTKTAMTAIALSPLAVLTAPVSLPAAGTTGLSAALAYTGATLSVISLATPAIMASRNVIEAVKNGDDALCSMVKYGADVPVKAVDNLKWGAMGPVVKVMSPALKPLAAVLNLGPNASKYALIAPGAIVSGKGVYDNAVATKEGEVVINNIERALEQSKRDGDKAHVAVLEEMLREAKDQRWINVIGLAKSSVSVLDAVKKCAESPNINEDISVGQGTSTRGNFETTNVSTTVTSGTKTQTISSGSITMPSSFTINGTNQQNQTNTFSTNTGGSFIMYKSLEPKSVQTVSGRAPSQIPVVLDSKETTNSVSSLKTGDSFSKNTTKIIDSTRSLVLDEMEKEKKEKEKKEKEEKDKKILENK
jgi:hypothetical protein